MSPQEPKRRRRRIVIGLGLLLVLLAGAGAVFALTREGDVSNPDVEFRDEPAATPAPEQEPAQPRQRQAGRSARPLHLGPLRLHAATAAATCRPEGAPPAVPGALAVPGRRAARVPAGDRRQRLYLLNDSGLLRAINKHTGKVRWKRKLGAPRRGLAGLRATGPSTPRCCSAPSSGRGARSGASSRSTARRARSAGARDLASRTRVLAADRRRHGSTSAPRTARVYAMGAARRATCAGASSAAGAVKGGLALVGRQALLRRLRRPRVRGPRRQRPPGLAREHAAAARFGLGAGNFYSTRRSPSAASTSATPTAGSTRSPPQREARVAQSTGGYVYASPAVAQVPGGRPTGLRGLLQRPLLRARRAQRAVRWIARRQRPDLRRRRRDRRHRLLRRPRPEAHDRARRAHGPQGLRARARLLQPGRLRRPTIFLTGYHAIYALRRSPSRGERAARAARRPSARREAQGERQACLRRARKAPRASRAAVAPLLPALRGPQPRRRCASAALRRTGTPAAASTALTSATDGSP